MLSMTFAIRFLLEQPRGSALWAQRRVAQVFEAYTVWQSSFWGGNYATPLEKATCTPRRHTIWSNDQDLLTAIHARASYMSKEDMEKFGGQCVNRKRKADGSGEYFSGNKSMKQSQNLGSYLLRMRRVCSGEAPVS